ncbi:hypothetical protein LQ953_04575 [Sphingomonas sp. IC-56]|uniref:hypothetical protein n=1 Tax=Sphingomonas sp. IC-56 TaxID=2898529 RepID=UPI001E4B9FD9|nr:hypothetical protein [Sphingomonas sp. IC-56]MCD2323289.1 hypothetical protein [Sphingomonas sp. IC-56]
MTAASISKSDAYAPFGVALLLTVVTLIAATPFSIGLWDEIYYISWINDPNAYDALVHPFGLLLHPIYAALGRSLIALRLFGIALLIGTGAIMGAAIERYYRVVAPDARLALLPIAGALAGTLYYVLWAVTPSYNMLANAGAALVLAGMFGWAAHDRGSRTRDWLPSLYCGFGGALAFLGKPTFAVLAGAFVALQLLVLARRDLRTALTRGSIAGVAAIVPVLISILSVMSLPTFFDRVKAGVAVLSSDYSTFSLVAQTLGSVIHAPPYLFVAIAVLAASVIAAARSLKSSEHRSSKIFLALNAAALLLDAAMFALLLRRGLVYGTDPWTIAIGTPVVGMLLATFGAGVTLNPAILRAPTRYVPILLLTVVPYLVAFGTANDLLRQAGMSLFPVLIAAVLCVRLCFPQTMARLAELAWIALCLVLLAWSAYRPYNQPSPVFAATEMLDAPFTRSRLRVDAATAAYARDLQQLARKEGIGASTPVLDLSGVAPGTVALLGARAPFFPWMIHFSKQPGILAAAAWESMTPEERKRAWIVGPIDPRFTEHPAIARLARSGGYRRAAVLRYGPAPEHPPVIFWAPTGS